MTRSDFHFTLFCIAFCFILLASVLAVHVHRIAAAIERQNELIDRVTNQGNFINIKAAY